LQDFSPETQELLKEVYDKLLETEQKEENGRLAAYKDSNALSNALTSVFDKCDSNHKGYLTVEDVWFFAHLV
jgi:hypothetical protein